MATSFRARALAAAIGVLVFAASPLGPFPIARALDRQAGPPPPPPGGAPQTPPATQAPPTNPPGQQTTGLPAPPPAPAERPPSSVDRAGDGIVLDGLRSWTLASLGYRDEVLGGTEAQVGTAGGDIFQSPAHGLIFDAPSGATQ